MSVAAFPKAAYHEPSDAEMQDATWQTLIEYAVWTRNECENPQPYNAAARELKARLEKTA